MTTKVQNIAPNRYQYFDFGLTARENFFLTVVLQKYWQFYKLNDDAYGYIPVNELRIILGQDYVHSTIKKLIDAGYIEAVIHGASNSNKWGNTVYGYKPLIYDFKVVYGYFKFIEKYFDYRYKRLTASGKIVLAQLRKTKIEITKDEFENALQQSYADYLKKPIKRHRNKQTIEQYINTNYWLYDRLKAFNSARGKEMYPYISMDDFGGRIHHIITSIPSTIRKYVTISKVKIVELDLYQSQPTILAHLLEQYVPNNSFTNALTSNGGIYNQIQLQFNLKSRDEAKTMLFKMIYGHPFSNDAERFYQQFPDIKQPIVDIKSTKSKNNPSPKIYSNLAWLMQQEESRIFKKIWHSLKANRIPFLPIHDAILVRVKDRDVQTAERLMYQHLQKELDYYILIKKK